MLGRLPYGALKWEVAYLDEQLPTGFADGEEDVEPEDIFLLNVRLVGEGIWVDKFFFNTAMAIFVLNDEDK